MIINKADKSSGIVVWDRKDYLTEARARLEDKGFYKELQKNVEGPLMNIIKSVPQN